VLKRFREVATELDAAVVIASHDEPTLAIADRLVRMRDGRIEDIEVLSGSDGPHDDSPAQQSAQTNQGR